MVRIQGYWMNYLPLGKKRGRSGTNPQVQVVNRSQDHLLIKSKESNVHSKKNKSNACYGCDCTGHFIKDSPSPREVLKSQGVKKAKPPPPNPLHQEGNFFAFWAEGFC